MIGKKINQLATELAPAATDLTIIGDPTTGVSKKITLEQISSLFGGSVSFYTNLASFPAIGSIDTIYCAKNTQKLYLWNGSSYTEIFPSQALLDTYQLRSEKGNANGYASLDSGGKVPISQLPSSIMEYKGTWNASTNTPTLANGTGDTGDVYICNVAGTVNFGAGPLTFAVGDYVIYSGSIWQRSSGAVGTVTSVAASITGDSLTISGSPVTTSGTLAFAFAGTTAQYIRGNGTLQTFPSLTGFVPYTGATANVDLGTHTLLAKNLVINHSSGSGVAASITKGGSGEALTVVKSSGSGNAASITGGVTLLDELHLNTDLADAYIASATNWNAAYNDKINSAAVTGTTTKTLTLTQQDGGTITASWTDDNTDAVTSVFGRTGAVVATSGDYNTSQVTESGNLYFTNARAIASTLTGYTSGAGTITSSDSILSAIQKLNGNIGALTTGVSSVNGFTGAVTLTTSNIAEGTNLYYTEARVNANTNVAANTAARHNAVTIGTANGLSLSTQVLSLGLASTSTTGALSSTDWNTFNNKTSNTGTVTSVGLSSATSGVTIGSTPITTSGTITLAIATASGSQQGLLSSTDWTTFNNKQNALTNPVTGTGTTNYLPKFTGASTIGDSNLINDASGNLGLGVTPSAWVSTYKAIQVNSYASFAGNSDDLLTAVGNNFYNDGVAKYIGTGQAALYTQYQGQHRWNTAPSGTAGNAISFTQAMTLDASGNLLVGNTSSVHATTGRGVIEVNGTTSVLGLTINGAEAGYLYHGGTNLSVWNSLNGAIEFGTNNAERMRISSGGQLRLNTYTSSSAWTGTSVATLGVDASGNVITMSGGGGGISGSGTANQLTYWDSSSSVTGSATLTYSPTSSLLVSPTITASSGIARGMNLTPVLIVAASNDNLIGLDIVNSFRGSIATGTSSTTNVGSGTGYTNGTYTNVPLTGGTGSGALATVTIIGGSINSVNITTSGSGYSVGDILSASNTNLGGTGSGFQRRVVTLVNTPRLIGARIDGIHIGRGGGYNTTNTAVGANALVANTSGTNNTAFGSTTMQAITTGSNNTAFGQNALSSVSTGSGNTVFGANAMNSGSSSIDNVAVGRQSLANSSGSYNVSIGAISASGSGASNNNVIVGYNAYGQITTGSNNIVLGYQAGRYAGSGTGTNNTTSTNSLYIGYDVRPSANANSNEVVIAGYNGSAGAIGLGSNTTSIGNSSTTKTFLYGRTILGTTTDNGTDRLQVNGSATFSSSVSLTSGYLSVDAFGNKDTNYITMRSGFSPEASGGIGFKAIDHSGSGTDGLACYGHDGISFYTAQSERIRITSDGAVLIGTTTEGFLGKLQVAGSVAITGQYNTVLPSSSFSYFDGSGQVVSSSSNASALYLDTTWNTTGNPDGIYLNVANTASGASSKLLNLKVDSVSKFSVAKDGTVAIGNSVATGVSVASTHKVSILIGGVQYYLLASNV
jgi:hypothetical protein